MAASAENFIKPIFLIASEKEASLQIAEDVRFACARVLGFDPDVRLAVAGDLEASPSRETFVIPSALDFSLIERETLGQRIAEMRREGATIYHDDVDPGHPLVVEALASQAARALGEVPPQKAGLIFVASGHGDPSSRAQSYRLMRLLWEQLGFAKGEVAFVRHVQPFLSHALEKFAAAELPWVLVFQSQWETEHVQYARVILENFQKSHPQRAAAWRFADPPGAHPLLTAWLAQRITRLWQDKRSRESQRMRSVKSRPIAAVKLACVGEGIVACTPDRRAMAEALEKILPPKPHERVIVKVTWHGYATGTYTDPAALDLLLSALPAKAIIVEGHTSSRSHEEAGFDWETQAREHRAWIRQQEAEYLRRTGLADVLQHYGAQYVNVTEAFWAESLDTDPSNISPAKFIPSALLDYRGSPMISFAKFKGPTRLAISNLFGLLPAPLRSAWHGPNITYFARMCCEIVKLYGQHFELCAIDEALYSAVRWNRQGLYRSRWGNYDLITDSGIIAASRNLASADILAARLQGQDVHRSAFFDVVRAELGWDEAAANDPLPEEMRHLFA